MGTCTNDFLKIHDGDGTLVQETCNPRRPPNVLTVNNPAAVLTFHSDSAEQGKGFRIQYEMCKFFFGFIGTFKRFISVCEKRVNGNGTIQTWNFPNGGAAGTCTYIIEAPKTHVISVRFLTIGLRVLPMSECFYTPNAVETYENYVEVEFIIASFLTEIKLFSVFRWQNRQCFVQPPIRLRSLPICRRSVDVSFSSSPTTN